MRKVILGAGVLAMCALMAQPADAFLLGRRGGDCCGGYGWYDSGCCFAWSAQVRHGHFREDCGYAGCDNDCGCNSCGCSDCGATDCGCSDCHATADCGCSGSHTQPYAAQRPVAPPAPKAPDHSAPDHQKSMTHEPRPSQGTSGQHAQPNQSRDLSGQQGSKQPAEQSNQKQGSQDSNKGNQGSQDNQSNGQAPNLSPPATS